MSTLHRSPLRRRLLAAVLICLGTVMLPGLSSAAEGKRLRIGITLHPYYSYVSNIVGDKAEVVPLIPAGFNPHAYEPRAEDIKRIGGLDVVVLNGVGHDDFAERMIAASEKPGVALIEANAGVPLLAATGQAARGAGKVVNPHTFLSISASIAQINTIARELGKLDPDNAKAYRQNARAYGKRLRLLRADALGRLSQEKGAELRVYHHPRCLRLPAARVRPGGDRRGRAGARYRTQSEPVEENHRSATGTGRAGDLLRDGFPIDLCRDHSA